MRVFNSQKSAMGPSVVRSQFSRQSSRGLGSFPVRAKIRSGRFNEFAQLATIQSSLGKSRLA